MNIAIINGPNLNLLGKREPEKYGSQKFEDYFEAMTNRYPDVHFTYFQSNIEGEVIDAIQDLGTSNDFIILNAASYTHTSIGIADAVAAIDAPVVEVHISNIYARESFRHHSYVSPVAAGLITGFGLKGYELAVEACLMQV